MLYACDKKWWHKYHPKFDGLCFSAELSEQPGVVLLQCEANKSGLSKDPSMIFAGGNGGHQAMNLAFHLGAARIVLIGYDMKVSVKDGSRLVAVGKTLDARIVDGESIGFMLFRRDGGTRFREILDRVIREPDAVKRWYLSAVNEMAQTLHVAALPITGLWWGELDSPADLAELREALNDAVKQPGRVQRSLFARV